jgi:hypothetical protein
MVSVAIGIGIAVFFYLMAGFAKDRFLNKDIADVVPFISILIFTDCAIQILKNFLGQSKEPSCII